jgi:glutamyl-tRNA synthetase
MATPSDASVRVRFAPSPTGMLHIGGLRTALYNYLFARQHDGTFVLRIEDTDRDRFVEEAEADILTSMRWAGFSADEGPESDGEHAPYHQSRRSEIYHNFAQQLIDDGHAYYAFDTPEELEVMREKLEAEGVSAPAYDATTRSRMQNALTLTEGEVQERLDRGDPYVVRLKVPRDVTVRFEDVIRGSVAIDAEKIDDQVLLKSDGMPTYHLANVVDDHLMEITHIIRGEEWLPSTPKHILLYKAFGWTPPQMAHLPLILNPNGGKLSKRNAEEMGIPVSVREYREAGYEPEALINYLAFLGWNPGTDEEVFTLDELVEAFSLDRVGSAGTQFDLDKLEWYNQQHLRLLSVEEIAKRAKPYLEAHGYEPEVGYLHEVVALMQDRLSFTKELATSCGYFFEDPTDYEEKGVKKRWKDDSADLLLEYADLLEEADAFTVETTESILRELADDEDVGAGRIIHPTRLAVSGMSYGPSLFDMMVVLGRNTCARRMRRAADELG